MRVSEPVAIQNGHSSPQAAVKPRRRFWHHVATGFRILQVRLRFLIVLLGIFVLVGKWDTIRNYWDKLTRSAFLPAESVSPDIEYWCPMCPGVVSDWPGKCPVCNMGLVQRKRGEAVPLPDGVVARMQLSPYRMQLAGIQTSTVGYRSLVHETEIAGFVQEDEPRLGDAGHAVLLVKAEAFAKDLAFLKEGQSAQVSSDALPAREPFEAKVRALRPSRGSRVHSFEVWLQVQDPGRDLRPGLFVTARVQVPVAQIEPFRSMPTDPPPLKSSDPRKVFVCPQHAGVLSDRAGRCPVDHQDELEERPLAANQRLQWWCPMHPRVTTPKPGALCAECNGMKLVPRVVTYNPPGQVLALPESAIIDTGAKRMVYVDRGGGMFDGVEVVLGPRCGDFLPVVRGVEAGQQVATAGAFLIDAETRLNPSVAAGYFGAAQPAGASAAAPPAAKRPESPPVPKGLLRLAPADQALALKQKICPVTGKPLGSMGKPTRVVVKGKVIFLCCDGCESELTENPDRYLSDHHD